MYEAHHGTPFFSPRALEHQARGTLPLGLRIFLLLALLGEASLTPSSALAQTVQVIGLTNTTTPQGYANNALVFHNGANGITAGVYRWDGSNWTAASNVFLNISTPLGSTASGSNAAAIGPNALASGANAVALGNLSAATGQHAISIGAESLALEWGIAVGSKASAKVATEIPVQTFNSTLSTVVSSIAIGTSSNAHGNNAISIGTQTEATDWSIALGANAKAISGAESQYGNAGAIAIGHNAVAKSQAGGKATGEGNTAIAIGDYASANWSAIAIGFSAKAFTYGAIALGYNATTVDSNSQSAIAIGDWAKASGKNAIAIGGHPSQGGTTASEEGSVSIGTGSQSSGKGTVAIGGLGGLALDGTPQGSTASKNYAFAAGAAARATGISSVAIGGGENAGIRVYADAQGENAIAIGTGASASKASSLAFGAGANAADTSAIAIGTGANAKLSDTFALGTQATATQAQTFAIGSNAAASATGAMALGVDSSATEQSAMAIGLGAKALGSYSISIGTGNTVKGNRSGAMGDPSIINGDDSYSIGNNNRIGTSTNNAFALGNSVYLGADAGGVTTANVSGAVALGSNSQVTVAGGVAIGQNSVADHTLVIGAAAYLDANTDVANTKAKLAAVSVGNATNTRQITNVAAGNNDTDAVNIAQLKAVSAVADMGFVVETTSIGTGSASAGTANATVAPGGNIRFVAGDNMVLQQNGTQTTFSVRPDPTFTSIAIGANTFTALGLVIGNSSIQADGLHIQNGASVTSAGIDAGGKKITAVDVGTAPTDAVNVSQLSQQTSSAATKWVAGAQTTTYVAPVASGDESTAVGSAAVASGSSSTAVGTSAQATGLNSVALGAGSAASTANSVALGHGSTTQNAVATASTIIRGDTYSFAGATPQGVVSVGSLGAERQIQSVAAGQLSASSTDAVNGSQLYATNQAIQSIAAVASAGFNMTTTATGSGVVHGSSMANIGPGGTATFVAGNNVEMTQQGTEITIALSDTPSFQSVTANTISVSAGGPSMTLSGINAANTAITNVAAGLLSATSTEAVNGSQLYATNQAIQSISALAGAGYNVATAATGSGVVHGSTVATIGPASTATTTAGNNIVLTQNAANLTFAVNDNPNFQSVTVGHTSMTSGGVAVGATTVNSSGVSVENGPSMTAAGFNANHTTMTNVAPGVNNSDAVNVEQLESGLGRVNQGLVGLQQQMADNRRDANAGSASAMAMAGMPQAYLPGKSMLAAGAATYNGQSALAIGLSTISNNGKWVGKFSGSTNSRRDVGMAVGLGYQW